MRLTHYPGEIDKRALPKKGGRLYRFCGDDGRCFGEKEAGYDYDPVLMTDPVVPAEPGSRAYLIFFDNEGARPDESGFYMQIQPIIAWRIKCWDGIGFVDDPRGIWFA